MSEHTTRPASFDLTLENCTPTSLLSVATSTLMNVLFSNRNVTRKENQGSLETQDVAPPYKGTPATS